MAGGAIWVKVASGQFQGGSGGGDRTHFLGWIDWGLQVKEVMSTLVVVSRSSGNARVRLHLDEAPAADVNKVLSLADPIGATSGGASLPASVKGTNVSNALPYLRPSLIVNSTGGADEWVEVEFWMGGRPY